MSLLYSSQSLLILIIDIVRYHQRQIALQLQYDGGSYLGFASQNDEETVEKHLFAALTKLKLIQDRQVAV